MNTPSILPVSTAVSTTPDLAKALVEWRRLFPEISEEEALADLFSKGVKTNQTYAAFAKRMAEAEDDRHNVFKHPFQFSGWHIASCRHYKHGIYQFSITRFTGSGAEMLNGFCAQDVLRVAIEQRICSKPNGFMLPENGGAIDI